MDGVPPGASIWMLNDAGRDGAPRLSVTITEKEAVIAEGGTPVSAPVAGKVTEYCLPEVVGGSTLPEVIVIAGPRVMENGAWSDAPVASVTTAVKLMVAGAAAMGVPSSAPPGVSESPVPPSPVADQT